MRLPNKFIQTVIAISVTAAMPYALTACGNTVPSSTASNGSLVSSSHSESNNDESAKEGSKVSKNLTSTASYRGVSFAVDPSWENTLDSPYGGVEPTIASKITVNVYRNGETANSETIQEKCKGILGGIDKYQQDSTWTIEGGTQATSYSREGEKFRYSCVVGYNAESNKGFVIFFNRGTKEDPRSIDDDLYQTMMQSIRFDPAGVPDSYSSSAGSDSGSNSRDSGVLAEGTYKVGTDIPAGEYKLTATSGDMGYWEVTNSSSADADIVGNDNFTGSAYVTVSDGQYLKLVRCTAESTSD